ncbi:MAG: cation:proton antiporter [Chloroflexi bacterium]|nr:cation:proton antiporter [Chloroflexota bacterium]
MQLDLLALVLLLMLAYVAGTLVNRLGYPSIIGELGVGIVFGPPILGLLQPNPTLAVLGTLGTLFLMLLVGMRIDARDLAKASGTALLVAVGGFGATFAVGYFVTTLVFGRSSNEGLIVAVAIGNTALATLPRILLDLGLIEARVGQFLAAVSLVTVALLLTSFAAVDSIVRAGGVDLFRLGDVLLRAGAFLVGAALIGIFIFPRLRATLSRFNLVGRTNSFAVALFIGLFYAGLANLAGLAVILGAFIAGIFLREDMFPEGDFPAVLASLEDVAVRFLAPIFFVAAGFPFSFSVFQTSLFPVLLLIVLALLGKFLAGALLSRFGPLTWRESAVLGFGMNAKGGVDIVVARSGLESKALSNEMYSIVVLLATVGSLLTPVLLKLGRDWLVRRGELTAARSVPELATVPVVPAIVRN